MKKYVIVYCDKHTNVYFIENDFFEDNEKFSLKLNYAKKFEDYDTAKKCAEHLTKKYNLDFHVFEF